jgi:Glycosyl transferase family 90
MAIFWGGPNGFDRKNANTPAYLLEDTAAHNNSSNNNATERQKCFAIPRCRFVYMYHNSSLISAKLHKTRGKVADVIDGIPVAAQEGRKSIQELLQYKALVMLEGNDVSSGLTWALFSNSVVMIPPPTFTSFAMEEVLEPYVHYVPLKRDLSNAEEQMQWILDHDDDAQRIAQNGRNWIRDMFLHDDSQKDNDRINEEIVQRYRMHFVSATDKNRDNNFAMSR